MRETTERPEVGATDTPDATLARLLDEYEEEALDYLRNERSFDRIEAARAAILRHVAPREHPALAVLRRVEWADVDEWGYQHCPDCGRSQEGGHAPGCALDAALRGAVDHIVDADKMVGARRNTLAINRLTSLLVQVYGDELDGAPEWLVRAFAYAADLRMGLREWPGEGSRDEAEIVAAGKLEATGGEVRDWIERIIWDAMWHRAGPLEEEEECSWDEALEYEAEFGHLVPETIHAAVRIRERLAAGRQVDTDTGRDVIGWQWRYSPRHLWGVTFNLSRAEAEGRITDYPEGEVRPAYAALRSAPAGSPRGEGEAPVAWLVEARATGTSGEWRAAMTALALGLATHYATQYAAIDTEARIVPLYRAAPVPAREGEALDRETIRTIEAIGDHFAGINAYRIDTARGRVYVGAFLRSLAARLRGAEGGGE